MVRWPFASGILAALAVCLHAQAGDYLLSNQALEIRLDEATGAVLQVTGRLGGLNLVANPGLSPAFRILTPEGVLGPGGPVQATPDLDFDGTAFDLFWTAADNRIAVRGRIELPSGEKPARWTSALENALGPRVDWFEFPVISGIGSLATDPARTEAILPFATGYRISDPLAHLTPGDRLGYYPDAYGGAGHQQLSYLLPETGGFHFQVEDATGQAKHIDLWKDGSTGLLEFVVRVYNPDLRSGQGLVPAGAVVLAASRSGTWEEGADRYREWAAEQWWAAAGPRREWPAGLRSRWLYETVGVTTFGISVRRDQTAWFRGLKNFLGVPLFHISGFWWPGGTFLSEWYGGYNDWSDDRVLPANLQSIRGKGDRVALFLFPQHFSRDAYEYHNPAADPGSDPVAPWAPFAMDPDPESGSWSYICPATAAWPAFYGWRAVTLMSRHLPDAEYLDIGPGLGRVHCEDPSHGHAPGWGRPVVEGVWRMLDHSRVSLHQIRGRFVPRGTELISELYLDRFDYYQARADAGPLTMLEGDKFRGGVKAGWAEKIPLFDYVYHDLGPVRLDGNLKLASQLGGAFFWAAAKVVLEGGLPELNYELSALERLPGMSGPAYFETYRAAYDCQDTTPYDADPARADFLKELADLRTRRGVDFLAYGRMRRGPQFASPPAPVTVDFRLYNTFNRAFTCDTGTEAGPEFFDTGNFAISPVLGTGWSAPFQPAGGTPGERPVEMVGLALAEVGGAARSLTLDLDPARQGVPLLNFAATLRRRGADEDLGVLHAGAALPLNLAAFETALIVLAPAPCAGPDCRYRIYRSPAPGTAFSDEALLAEASGHTYSDPVGGDGKTWFYLVDDGGGYPVDSLRLTRGAAIDLAW